MKKFFILIIFFAIVFSFTTNAQKVGFQMGVNFSKIKFGQSIEYEDQKTLITPKLGFFIDIPVYEGFFISSGLFTNVKGFRYESTRDIGDIAQGDYETFDSDENFIILYLNIPINFGYKFDLDEVKLFAKTGPYFDIGLYSTILYKYDGSTWDNEKIYFGTPSIYDMDDWDNIYINRTDLGWNIEGGIQYNRFQFSIFYSFGFKNVLNLSDWDNLGYDDSFNFSSLDSKNRAFGFNFAVLFGNVDGKGNSRSRGGWRR